MIPLFLNAVKKLGEEDIKSCSVVVQRERVQDGLHRINAFGVCSRIRNVLHHLQYNVSSPNAFWHFDGYHKWL